jgi:hypothetical protein
MLRPILTSVMVELLRLEVFLLLLLLLLLKTSVVIVIVGIVSMGGWKAIVQGRLDCAGPGI